MSAHTPRPDLYKFYTQVMFGFRNYTLSIENVGKLLEEFCPWNSMEYQAVMVAVNLLAKHHINCVEFASRVYMAFNEEKPKDDARFDLPQLQHSLVPPPLTRIRGNKNA